MRDQDVQDIKQELADLRSLIQENHASLFKAVGIVDDQVGKVTEAIGDIAAQINKRTSD